MKKSLALTAVLLLALGLAGCANEAPTVQPADASPAQSEAAVEPAAAEAPAEEAKRTAAFGDTVTWESGVQVTASFLGFQPAGATAFGAVEGQMAVFEITVVNGSDAEIEAGLMGFPTVRAGESGSSVTNANDFQAGIGMDSFSTILPGDTQKVTAAYGIPAADAGKIQMEIMDPSFMGKDAIFQGAIQ